MNKKRIILGTRGSKLAVWQAEWVKARLEELHPGLKVELLLIKTTGDKILDVPLAKVGGKGLFVKEIEEAMLRLEIDIAVHSMKDVPTEFPDGLHLASICEREDPRDAVISKGIKFADLPQGAKVGTSSLRRSCQMLHLRPDLEIVPLRGNLETRFRKLEEGQFVAMILATAGVKRLGWADRITEIVSTDLLLPAIGQGAIGIECRVEDDEVNRMIAPLNHRETALRVRAERACLIKLEGGCQVPIAAHALFTPSSSGDRISMRGLVGSTDGKTIIRSQVEGEAVEAESLGLALAEDLLSKGAREILAEVYGHITDPSPAGEA